MTPKTVRTPTPSRGSAASAGASVADVRAGMRSGMRAHWPHSLQAGLRAGALLVGTMAAGPAAAQVVRGTADINGVATVVELRTANVIGTLRHRPAAGPAAWTTITLDGPSKLLPLLADTRLSFLWAPLEAWAGQDLTGLRDAAVTVTQRAWQAGTPIRAPDSPVQGIGRPRTRALVQYADALRRAGRFTDAVALLEAERARMPLKGNWDRLEWAAVSSMLATSIGGAGDRARELVLLRESDETLGDSPYRLNLRISLAARLAEAARYDEALALSESTRAAFLLGAKGTEPVPGAVLQFDWVKACALHGLGRAGEAAAVMAGIAVAAQPEHRRLAPPRNRDVEERGYLCARDDAALASLWTRDLARVPIGSDTLMIAQPHYLSVYFDQPTIDRARGRFAGGAPMRVLPERYHGALRGWR